MPRQKLPIDAITVDKSQPDHAEAYKLLHRAAEIVHPIMKARSYKIGHLTEIPHKGGLPKDLGLNYHHGKTIKVLLRTPSCSFLSIEAIVDTLLHELCHNKCGPHDEEFWALYKALLKDLAKIPGYENFVKLHLGDRVMANLCGGVFRNPKVTHDDVWKRAYTLGDDTCHSVGTQDRVAAKPSSKLVPQSARSGEKGGSGRVNSGQTTTRTTSTKTTSSSSSSSSSSQKIYRPSSSYHTAVQNRPSSTQGSSSRGRSSTVSKPSSAQGYSSGHGYPSGHGSSSSYGSSSGHGYSHSNDAGFALACQNILGSQRANELFR